MILDTSAVIAIIQREPGWQQIRSQLEQANLLRISAGTLQELLLVAHCRGVLDVVEELLLLLDADVVPVDEDLARRAGGTDAVSACQCRGRLLHHRIIKGFGDDMPANNAIHSLLSDFFRSWTAAHCFELWDRPKSDPAQTLANTTGGARSDSYL